MMKFIHLLLAAAFAVLPAAVAGQSAAPPAACRLRIDAAASSWIIRGYDPFGNSAPSGTFELIFTNEGDRECTFYPIFSVDQEPFGLRANNGRRVPYALADMYGNYDATPVAGRTQRRATRRSVVVAPRSQQVVQYGFTVAEDMISGDGLYDQRVQIEAEGTDGLPLSARQLVLGIDVLPSATLGLSGAYQVSNGQALVDLGELREGFAEVPLQLRVQSTRRYKLILESQNNGRLELPGTDWFVPYQMSLGGQSVALSSGRGELSGQNGQGLTRESLPIRFRIGDVSDQRAGTYSDVISVSVEPL
ncbi:hypothetical protein RCO27_17395 [Sphingosinicella sp. LHD-64]|uniref:hypothetical protein n=1 Tax=Sphingosinicella sp. LHD-64 TaxID=3072139 RepID=UPI00280EA7CB|nr:hypothetical protein [Sphingosinicella sp. LHD-64]MDQ8758004.1 hypothetical protein [Sphingosinicella sp. LHD-64]